MKRNTVRNGSDEDYDVNSVVDSGTDEWHMIADHMPRGEDYYVLCN